MKEGSRDEKALLNGYKHLKNYWYTYNHILPNFERFQNFHFLDKSCILKAFGWDSVIERQTIVYYGVCSYWVKVSFPGNQAWRTRKKLSKFLEFRKM